MPAHDSPFINVFERLVGEGISSKPAHADMGELAQVVSELDRIMDDAMAAKGDAQDEFDHIVGQEVDGASVAYVAIQRAIRALGVTNRNTMMEKSSEVLRIAAAWMEAFTVGSIYRRNHVVHLADGSSRLADPSA